MGLILSAALCRLSSQRKFKLRRFPRTVKCVNKVVICFLIVAYVIYCFADSALDTTSTYLLGYKIETTKPQITTFANAAAILFELEKYQG